MSGDRTCDNDVTDPFVNHVGENGMDEVHNTENIRTSDRVYAFEVNLPTLVGQVQPGVGEKNVEATKGPQCP